MLTVNTYIIFLKCTGWGFSNKNNVYEKKTFDFIAKLYHILLIAYLVK